MVIRRAGARPNGQPPAPDNASVPVRQCGPQVSGVGEITNALAARVFNGVFTQLRPPQVSPEAQQFGIITDGGKTTVDVVKKDDQLYLRMEVTGANGKGNPRPRQPTSRTITACQERGVFILSPGPVRSAPLALAGYPAGRSGGRAVHPVVERELAWVIVLPLRS